MFYQLDGDLDSFPLDEIFLIIVDIGFGKGYRKSSLFGIILFPYWGIRFDDELLLSVFPYRGIQLDLQNNILYFPYLRGTSPNRPLGQAD